MKAKVDLLQRDRFVKNDPDLLFTFLRSAPTRPFLQTECGFNREAGMF
jgi:hypothetical protein